MTDNQSSATNTAENSSPTVTYWPDWLAPYGSVASIVGLPLSVLLTLGAIYLSREQVTLILMSLLVGTFYVFYLYLGIRTLTNRRYCLKNWLPYAYAYGIFVSIIPLVTNPVVGAFAGMLICWNGAILIRTFTDRHNLIASKLDQRTCQLVQFTSDLSMFSHALIGAMVDSHIWGTQPMQEDQENELTRKVTELLNEADISDRARQLIPEFMQLLHRSEERNNNS